MEFIPIASSSKGNAYLVTSGDTAPLLIECGIPIKQLREKLHYGKIDDLPIPLSSLAGCLVSHSHFDHCIAVNGLLKRSVDVWTSYETALALHIIDYYRVSLLETGRIVKISEWTVYPFNLNHDVPCHGFLIRDNSGEKLLFIPDTEFVHNRFEGVNIIAIECNHLSGTLSENIEGGNIPAMVGRRIRHNHMSLETTIKMLKANDLSKCRHIYLLHLSENNSDEAKMIKAVQEATGIPVTACGEQL